MGCWNKTCGLTNLPIMSGERTYVFILEREKEIDDHCYATHLYRPLLLPFESTYNDYGGGEDSAGAAYPVIMDAIKQHLVEMPVGENEYHDIAVSRAEWGEDLFFNSVHERRLRIHYSYQGETELEFVMMRQDVVDDLILTYEFDEYVGEHKGHTGYNNSYKRYRFVDVLNSVNAFLDAAIYTMKDQAWSWTRMDMVAFRMLEADSKNLAAKWLRNELGYRFSSIVPVRDLIMEMLSKGDERAREAAGELLVTHLRGMFVNSFMEMNRKSWIPGGHEGSQRQEYEPYRALMASMNRVMDARDAEYAEEHGEDEE